MNKKFTIKIVKIHGQFESRKKAYFIQVNANSLFLKIQSCTCGSIPRWRYMMWNRTIMWWKFEFNFFRMLVPFSSTFPTHPFLHPLVFFFYSNIDYRRPIGSRKFILLYCLLNTPLCLTGKKVSPTFFVKGDLSKEDISILLEYI